MTCSLLTESALKVRLVPPRVMHPTVRKCRTSELTDGVMRSPYNRSGTRSARAGTGTSRCSNCFVRAGEKSSWDRGILR